MDRHWPIQFTCMKAGRQEKPRGRDSLVVKLGREGESEGGWRGEQGRDSVLSSLCPLPSASPWGILFSPRASRITWDTALNSPHDYPNISHQLNMPKPESFSSFQICLSSWALYLSQGPEHPSPSTPQSPASPDTFPLCPSHPAIKSCWFKSHMSFVSTMFLFPCPTYPTYLPSCITEMIPGCVWGRGRGGRISSFLGTLGGGKETSPWLQYFSKFIIPYLLLFIKIPLIGCAAYWIKSNTLERHLRPSTIYPLSPKYLTTCTSCHH